MELPVLIEPVAGNGYVAKTGEPLSLRAEGPTPDDALQNLKRLIAARLTNGSQLVSVVVAPQTHPLAEFAGMFRDDPDIEDWVRDMAEYRRAIDADADRP